MVNEMIAIEVIYAGENHYPCVSMRVPMGTTIASAIEQSGFLAQYPEIADFKVGIFGELKALDDMVEAGDRVEIYRPITTDPIDRRIKQVKLERKAAFIQRHTRKKRELPSA